MTILGKRTWYDGFSHELEVEDAKKKAPEAEEDLDRMA